MILTLLNFYHQNQNVWLELFPQIVGYQCHLCIWVSTVTILSLPKHVKNAYMLLKILKSFIKIKHNVTTVHLKTALLHTSSKIIKSNISSGKNCGEIKRTIDAANMILLQYLKFIEDKYLPSYFFKMNLL